MFSYRTAKVLVIFVLGIILGKQGYGQVTIAPTNLFIDEGSRFGTYMVINGSQSPQEVSIDFIFGYAISDSVGDRQYIYDDSVTAEKYSLAESIKAFPQNFTLSPNQRQVVRLRISAPASLPDGTYWARIKTSASPVTPPIELENSDAVGARIGVVIDQISGVFYKKGNVSTGIQVDRIDTRLSEDKSTLSVLTNLRRTGNSPFLGTITTSLINANGTEVRRALVSTTIYFDGIHKEDFEIQDLPKGTYTIQVSFESSRSDISRDELIQIPRVMETSTYQIR